MTDIVKQQVVRLAASGRGFRVLVPDLYHGVVGVDMEEAGHVSRTAGRVVCRTAGHMPYGRGISVSDPCAPLRICNCKRNWSVQCEGDHARLAIAPRLTYLLLLPIIAVNLVHGPPVY